MIPPAIPASTAAAASARQGSTNQPAQIKKAAQEFEGILINTLWSSFQQDPMFGSDEDDSDPGAGSLRGMGLQAVSAAMAQSGGLGIAKMIERQLEPQNAAPNPAAMATELLREKK